MGDLTVINSEKSRGDQWLLDLLKFTPGEGGWTVRTASLHTPVKVNGGVTDGVFYCKTVAPSRLMEWFLLDSLL